MKYIILILYLLVFKYSGLYGQDITKIVTGQVSFISSQNTYVRFGNTSGINLNDTLYIQSANKLVPVLVVNNLSSTSCMCTVISNEELPVGHIIIAKIKSPDISREPLTLEEVKNDTTTRIQPNEPDTLARTVSSSGGKNEEPTSKQHITGSISAASYSDFSNSDGADIQRFRYTFTLYAKNIDGSGLSAESYISFRHKSGNWSEVGNDIFNALKIYSLAIKYDINGSTHLSLGRQINPRISSLGSFDGLQFEKSIKRFTMGVIGGSRPDYLNYGPNLKLFQFGGYLSYDRITDNAASGTSVALIDQLNSGHTDRRFMYFQHSSSISGRLSLFSSFEIDLFKLKNDKPVSDFKLTSFYMSLNYRMLNNFTIGGSYDARKTPVYYETFRTVLDSLTDSGLRQSYRIQSSIRISKSLLFGLQSSLRFLKSDQHQSKNLSGYLVYNLPGKSYFSATLSGNYIETSYLNGLNGGIALTKSILKGKVQTGAGYSYQKYRLPESFRNIIQHTGRADLYFELLRKMFVSLNYEVTFEGQRNFNRLYIQATKRF